MSATGWSEFVYWGRVSISQDDKFNCATDCLVLYHFWGTTRFEGTRDDYTVHLSARMPPQAMQNAVP